MQENEHQKNELLQELEFAQGLLQRYQKKLDDYSRYESWSVSASNEIREGYYERVKELEQEVARIKKKLTEI